MKEVVDGERGVVVDAAHARGPGRREVISPDDGAGESGQIVAGAERFEARAKLRVGYNG